jgi:hypothetical protein
MFYEERAMTKTEHLQFLVLMIPTFVILVAAAVSMADLALPAPSSELYSMVAANSQAAAAEQTSE